MARKLYPHEERAFLKAAPRLQKGFREKGCRARREQEPVASPVDLKNMDFTAELPNWDECSWPDEWGW